MRKLYFSGIVFAMLFSSQASALNLTNAQEESIATFFPHSMELLSPPANYKMTRLNLKRAHRKSDHTLGFTFVKGTPILSKDETAMRRQSGENLELTYYPKSAPTWYTSQRKCSQQAKRVSVKQTALGELNFCLKAVHSGPENGKNHIQAHTLIKLKDSYVFLNFQGKQADFLPLIKQIRTTLLAPKFRFATWVDAYKYYYPETSMGIFENSAYTFTHSSLNWLLNQPQPLLFLKFEYGNPIPQNGSRALWFQIYHENKPFEKKSACEPGERLSNYRHPHLGLYTLCARQVYDQSANIYTYWVWAYPEPGNLLSHVKLFYQVEGENITAILSNFKKMRAE